MAETRTSICRFCHASCPILVDVEDGRAGHRRGGVDEARDPRRVTTFAEVGDALDEHRRLRASVAALDHVAADNDT